ncbi:reverse transcriptase RNA-dependent DNA polymerase [Nitzschia inconspicua]|uniref:Reverse transcriptase RNA-dependent DNA polymerase n=1 Tax=Nitzschia inconspicua TaxID=303405 RepID=A0A9K3K894_9STRA|nr:reverse transcriptase RNA-dependent DNA polymerase [Nitzschia inconspicua]KAG7359354.1 reverse transcriptase RNA-dependent DNA polymerase [Nitzschia inconspicua]KAG7365679.1 reverse transcriptase RNA-dependent DNA polymerase [Nitzschia inconspicua]
MKNPLGIVLSLHRSANFVASSYQWVSQTPQIGLKQPMEEVLQDVLSDIEIYIDDIAIFRKTWDGHIQFVSKSSRLLQNNGFPIKPEKCVWAVQETNFLGFWLTPDGLK